MGNSINRLWWLIIDSDRFSEPEGTKQTGLLDLVDHDILLIALHDSDGQDSNNLKETNRKMEAKRRRGRGRRRRRRRGKVAIVALTTRKATLTYRQKERWAYQRLSS